MKTAYTSALTCLPRGAYRRVRRAQKRASAAATTMRLLLATAALAALTLSLSSVLHTGAEQVLASLDEVVTSPASR